MVQRLRWRYMEWDNEGGQWGTDKKKSSRKAQNCKSTEKAANSNGTSSRATDTTAREAKKHDAQAASLYQCNEPEVDSNVGSNIRLAEKLNRGKSLLLCAPTFSPPPKPCALARQGPPQCSQETTFPHCEKQLKWAPCLRCQLKLCARKLLFKILKFLQMRHTAAPKRKDLQTWRILTL